MWLTITEGLFCGMGDFRSLLLFASGSIFIRYHSQSPFLIAFLHGKFCLKKNTVLTLLYPFTSHQLTPVYVLTIAIMDKTTSTLAYEILSYSKPKLK